MLLAMPVLVGLVHVMSLLHTPQWLIVAFVDHVSSFSGFGVKHLD